MRIPHILLYLTITSDLKDLSLINYSFKERIVPAVRLRLVIERRWLLMLSVNSYYLLSNSKSLARRLKTLDTFLFLSYFMANFD